MAAAGGPVQDLCEEATCPICLEYFQDPVIIPECGHNFCRACLSRCWEKTEAEASSCPQCRARVQHRNLIPNRPLANVAEILIAKKFRLLGEEGAAGKRRCCEKHQEPLKLFCKDHEALICVVCDRSKEHKGHAVIPLEEASQEFKDQIWSSLENLRKEREKILALKADTQNESQELLELTEAERGKTISEFRQLQKFLEEQEKLLLAQMEKVEKEIAKTRDEHLANLSEKLSSLERIIEEMEEKHQQPASEFLEDVGSFLHRSQAKENLVNPPVTFIPELKWKIWDSCDINAYLEGVMKQFRETLESGLQLQKENITLDPLTAHCDLILSYDCKSVRCGEPSKTPLSNPERFDEYPYVLGHEGFIAGRHFWEVSVGSEEGWAVGVAKKSIKRKGNSFLAPEGGIWILIQWEGEYRASTTTDDDDPILSPIGELKKVRVTLNCEGGRVTFYNADTAAFLYTYSAVAFSGETLLPLFYVINKALLTLSA